MIDKTPRKIVTIYSTLGGKELRRVERFETPEELEERALAIQKKEESETYYRTHAETLSCDACGLSMGKVYASDLEGSRFYHNQCV